MGRKKGIDKAEKRKININRKSYIENKKRAERILNMNSVIKVFDKKWRSTRVC